MAEERNDLGYHWRRNAGVYDAAQPKVEAPPKEATPAEVEDDSPEFFEGTLADGLDDDETETPPEVAPPTEPELVWTPKPAKKQK